MIRPMSLASLLSAYHCKGGRVALGAIEPKFWEGYCIARERKLSGG